MKDAIKNVSDKYQKETEYKYGSVTFNIKREYSGKKNLGDIIGDMVLKKSYFMQLNIYSCLLVLFVFLSSTFLAGAGLLTAV